MDIGGLQGTDRNKFERFKSVEWKIADEQHYGNQPPNFAVLSETFIAKDGGRIIGQIELKVDQGVAKIESLLVGSDQQGKGVGRELVMVGEKWAVENGAHKITLETGLSWIAKGFYEKLGYQVRVVLPNDVAYQDFVLMDKMLVV
jgi:GNAT superfamily N-acetyltransferase